MNLDGATVEFRVDLEDVVWAILRENPEMQTQFILQLLINTDSWSVIEAVAWEASELLRSGGMIDE